MKSLVRYMLIVIVMIVAVLGFTQNSQAATGLSLSVSGDFSTCDLDIEHVISFSWTGSDDDGQTGGDWLGMIAFDADGVPIAADWDWAALGSPAGQTTPFGGGAGINAVTAWPVTIQLLDISTHPPVGENTQAIYDFIVADGGPVVRELQVGCGAEEEAEAVPGCDVTIAIPSTAVGGTFVADAPIYWAPGKTTSPLVTIPAGNSARVIGLDSTGEYYQIIWVCNFVWVPASTLGPNYDNVWHGAPLPTGVVN